MLEPSCNKLGREEAKNGMSVFRPVSPHNAWLTNNPNLVVPALGAF